MSIASEIERLQNAKADIKTSIESKGVTVPSNETLDNYSDYIDSIQTGGGGTTSVFKKDVNFYDYDGTIVNSYTKDEFLALNSLPENPTHSGLTSQGWNWSLSDAQEYVSDYGKLEIGQMYITDDGKTRIYITLEEGRTSPYLGFAINGTATIEWGDGSTQDVTGTSTSTVISTKHDYANSGDYIISLSSDDTITLLGNNSYGGSQVLWNNTGSNSPNHTYRNGIKKILFGNNVNFGSYALSNCYLLNSVSIPNTFNSMGTNTFRFCYSLKSVIIPNNVTSMGSNTFSRCTLLTSVSIPKSITTFGTYVFDGCNSLASITIPNTVTNIGTNNFNLCYSLTSIIIPNTVTNMNSSCLTECRLLTSLIIPNTVSSIGTYSLSNCYSLKSVIISNRLTNIGDYLFDGCYSLTSITIPKSITTIGAQSFNRCYSMRYYDFSSHTSIPTLSNANAFQYIQSDCKIIVPDSLYEDWKAATNWSNYASYIIKESEWNA